MPTPFATPVPVRGRFISETGDPLAGETILFTPKATVRKFTDDLVTLVGGSIRVALDADGSIPAGFTLSATDDPAVIPMDWTWGVAEEWLGGRRYSIPVPISQSTVGVDLTIVSPAPASGGVGWEVGPPGPPGPQGESGALSTKWFFGDGPPPEIIPGARPADVYVDKLTGIYYTLA